MLYAVHVLVDAARAQDWESWMRQDHIPEVIDTGCFWQAVMVREPEADEPEKVAFCTFYFAHDEQALERYQREFAPALKDDHAKRFGSAASAWRLLCPVLEVFTPKG